MTRHRQFSSASAGGHLWHSTRLAPIGVGESEWGQQGLMLLNRRHDCGGLCRFLCGSEPERDRVFCLVWFGCMYPGRAWLSLESES